MSDIHCRFEIAYYSGTGSTAMGGEIIPNTASGLSSIRLLKKKGYDIIYEEMIVMPSNLITATDESIAVKLLEILPSKTQRIVDDILSGARRRTSPKLIDRFLSKLGEIEKPFARSFGKSITVSGECDSCAWCSSHCPSQNISVKMGIPVFGNNCHMCLGCIYGCHKKALAPRIGKFMILKEGYDLTKLEKMVPLAEPVNIEEKAKGLVWSGVRKYLKEKPFSKSGY